MREIKFRVWNTLLKEYVPEDIVYLSPDGSLSFGSIMLDSAIYIKPNFQKYKDVILEGENIVERFTGLKDKNGTEIYEGDILIDDAGEPVEYWVVKFADGGFVGECAGVAEALFGLTNLEVVGNIHKDSELVEEK